MNPSPSQDAARKYLLQGYAPIPVPKGEKNPNRPGWQTLRLTEHDLPVHFPNGQNVSLLLGDPSSGLVDVDIDCMEALTVAGEFLPKTNMIHGRPTKARSHWWYRATPVPSTVRFRALDGSTLVEIRSTGGQTVVPPSIHPSGEQLAWESEGEPTSVPAAELYEMVADLAACVLLSRYWPGKGARHDMALALAGFFIRRQVPIQRVIRMTTLAARLAGDEEWNIRTNDIISTEKRIHQGRPATGGTALVKLLSPENEKGKGLGRFQLVRGRAIIDLLVDWLKLPEPKSEEPTPARERYIVLDGRLHRIKYKTVADPETLESNVVTEYHPLCNFSAEITEELNLDDGQEVSRVYTLRGALDTGERLPEARVRAKEFASLGWIGEHWGARPIPYAGSTTKDYIREGIQVFSENIPSRTLYTHTGWRVFDGQYVYLLPSGAIGRSDLEVELGAPELARISVPTMPEDEVGAVRESLALLGVAAHDITIPLLAAMYRAPLCHALPAPITVWLEGKTGSFKSTLEALFLCHYGVFDYTSLLAQWSSTANFLERRMFVLKDFPMVIDDYVPGSEQKNVEATAARVVRAQGNLAGRGRLTADATERLGYPPRGITVTSGEQRPPGAGILARCLLVPVDVEQINLSTLTKAQARVGRLPHAMSGYIRWLAPQMSQLPAILTAELAQGRATATVEGAHRRIPTSTAHLALGFSYFLAYARSVGAMTEAEAIHWEQEATGVFERIGARQAAAVRGEAPEMRFLRVLDELIERGKVTLGYRDSGERDNSTESERADLIGWRDADYWYLLPDAAHEWATKTCEAQREPLNARPERIREDLVRLGAALADEGRTTATVRIGPRSQDARRRLLKLKVSRVRELLGADEGGEG